MNERIDTSGSYKGADCIIYACHDRCAQTVRSENYGQDSVGNVNGKDCVGNFCFAPNTDDHTNGDKEVNCGMPARAFKYGKKEKSHVAQESLSFLALNVCGLKTKLLCPDFLDFVSQFDVIIFTETKLDDTDKVEIPGYTVFYKNRSKF